MHGGYQVNGAALFLLGGAEMSVGFPGGSVVKNLLANAGDAGSIPGLGRFPWRRKWQPTPVFLPGKSWILCGQRILVGYSLWGHNSQI